MAVNYDDVKKVPESFDKVLTISEKVLERAGRWQYCHRWSAALLFLIAAVLPSAGVASVTVFLLCVLVLTFLSIPSVRQSPIESLVRVLRDDAKEAPASLMTGFGRTILALFDNEQKPRFIQVASS
jgi:hypothetical protein